MVRNFMTMRKILFIVLFLLSVSWVKGQTAEEEVMRLKQQTSGAVLENAQGELQQGESLKEGSLKAGSEQEGRQAGHWNFSVGTSYSYMKGFGSVMNFYAAPVYTLPLNDRWSVHGGLMASRNQGLNYTPAGENLMPGAYSSLSLFAAASYRMNDRLILQGAGVKQLLSAPVTPFTPYPVDQLSFGATYKLGDNIYIGASIHMNQQKGYFISPYYPSPYGAPFPTPFGW
jgi:hypothetical protein